MYGNLLYLIASKIDNVEDLHEFMHVNKVVKYYCNKNDIEERIPSMKEYVCVLGAIDSVIRKTNKQIELNDETFIIYQHLFFGPVFKDIERKYIKKKIEVSYNNVFDFDNYQANFKNRFYSYEYDKYKINKENSTIEIPIYKNTDFLHKIYIRSNTKISKIYIDLEGPVYCHNSRIFFNRRNENLFCIDFHSLPVFLFPFYLGQNIKVYFDEYTEEEITVEIYGFTFTTEERRKIFATFFSFSNRKQIEIYLKLISMICNNLPIRLIK